MAKPRPSVVKRQREQAKREKQQMKAARRADRKNQIASGGDPDLEGMEPLDGPVVTEEP